jgi:hypothetical protein
MGNEWGGGGSGGTKGVCSKKFVQLAAVPVLLVWATIALIKRGRKNG